MIENYHRRNKLPENRWGRSPIVGGRWAIADVSGVQGCFDQMTGLFFFSSKYVKFQVSCYTSCTLQHIKTEEVPVSSFIAEPFLLCQPPYYASKGWRTQRNVHDLDIRNSVGRKSPTFVQPPYHEDFRLGISPAAGQIAPFTTPPPPIQNNFFVPSAILVTISGGSFKLTLDLKPSLLLRMRMAEHSHHEHPAPPTDEWKHSGVRVIPSDSLDSNTAQTPGM